MNGFLIAQCFHFYYYHNTHCWTDKSDVWYSWADSTGLIWAPGSSCQPLIQSILSFGLRPSWLCLREEEAEYKSDWADIIRRLIIVTPSGWPLWRVLRISLKLLETVLGVKYGGNVAIGMAPNGSSANTWAKLASGAAGMTDPSTDRPWCWDFQKELDQARLEDWQQKQRQRLKRQPLLLQLPHFSTTPRHPCLFLQRVLWGSSCGCCKSYTNARWIRWEIATARIIANSLNSLLWVIHKADHKFGITCLA